MKRYQVFISLSLAVLLLHSQAFSQLTGPFYIQDYDNRNGLSNSSINQLFSDKDNLLWVATWDGLNLYDGTSFHVFNYSKDHDSKSIGSNVIRNLTEDHRGNIWISTIEGVSRYEKRSGKFDNYFYNRYPKEKVSEEEYSIAADSEGNIYCLSQKNGLSYYDESTNTFLPSHLPNPNGKIEKIAFKANHLLLLNSNGQLDVCSGRQKQFTLIHTFLQPEGINDFFVIRNGVFFSTTTNQLYEVNPETLESQKVMQMPHSLSAMVLYNNHYLLAWTTRGYEVFDRSFKPSEYLSAVRQQMQGIRITSLSEGTENILWYGTDGNGIIKVYPKTKSFGTVATSENGMPYNKSVRAFCEENGNLWVGTKGSGIIRMFDFWSSEKHPPKKQYFLAPSQLDNNAVYALRKGSDGLIYIGTDGKGIGIYDLKNEKFHKWDAIKGHDKWPEFGSVYAIYQDSDQSLWLGTSGYGLIHLKISNDQKGNLSVTYLEKYTFNNSHSGPANDIIYSLAAGDKDHLWVGCRYGGLSLLNIKTKEFRSFKAFTYEGSLSNNDVLSVFKDSRDQIWIGTSFGLNLISDKDGMQEEPSFRKLTTINGLPNNTIHAIEEDRTGQIWVSTNKGLARVDPQTLKISYYQQSDGLQSNEFCDGAVWKDQQDNLFFGGTYGFNNFLPQNIHKSDWLPKLCISNISIGGKETGENGFIVRNAGNTNPLEYSIPRKDNFFDLDIRSLSFLNADKCEYAWFLEGYDKTWHYAGTNGKIMYTNILPGTYTLKIKWSNGEGSWTTEMPLLRANIKQFIWLTPYAFLLYLILVATVIYIIYLYRKNKTQIKHQLAVEHLMRTTEDEIHQNRLGFFTNIAHELQTPLTLIMGATERFLESPVRLRSPRERPYFLSLIHQQASKLTYLVHQLLEFRKGEEGFFENQHHYTDVSELLHSLSEPFTALGAQNEILYELNIQPGITGLADSDKIEKIVFNLLSNAFKYSPKKGQVRFEAISNKGSDQLEIAVTNSGMEIPQDQLNKLFDKFYSSSQPNLRSDRFGTGIGLAFTRQLVTMLDGTITVTSENNQVTFRVTLPLLPANPAKGPQQVPVNDGTSYLFQAITTYNETNPPVSTRENNKDAILEDLLDQDKKKVMIVEDEPEIRFLLKDLLKDEYIVYEAADGVEALELIGRVLPDMIICDIMMPNMNGLDLCHTIKEDTATCQVPVILLTARGSEAHHMEGFEVGADAYIAKPFNTAYLKLRIRKLLEYRQKLHEVFKDNSTDNLLDQTEMPAGDKEFLTRMVQVIEQHLEEAELNAVFLEKEFCMSKMQLYRKLKSLTSMTPAELIKSIRLKATAQLLANTQLTVTEIYFRTGFNNQSYFFREFKKKYACAPNEYRERNALRK